MLKKILMAVAVLLAGVLLFAATRPDTFRVERRALIQAPPEKIRAELVDFQRWAAWSPWEKMDPAMKRSFSTPSAGRGATYAWEGNEQVGRGRMAIIEDAPDHVVIKLDFLQPFEAHNTAEFTLLPRGNATEVTWAMHGPSPYVAKLMHLFFDMDAMVGRDFETGLANLKAVAEK
jgi:hypothetical protein